MGKWKLALITLVVLWFGLGSGSDAFAQSTGGSMGGGSFSSSGGGGGGSSYSSGGSYSSSGGSGGSVSGSGLVIIIIFAMLYLVVAATADAANVSEKMDVTVLQVAIDWRARKHVQKDLEFIAARSDTNTQAGLVAMLREVTVVLRRARQSWLYAGATNHPVMAREDAEAVFQREAQNARTGFQHELIRNADGEVRKRDAPEVVALTEEGEGVVLIALIIAARHELVDVHTPSDAEVMRAALESLGELTSGNLVAVEIVWSPAAEADRMSTAELESLYPDLEPIRGATVAGRVYCEYCDRPYTGELLSCPHCGAGADLEAAS